MKCSSEAVDRAVNQDTVVLWSTPLSAEEVTARFGLTTALKNRAAQLRQQNKDAHAVKSMPKGVEGRLMTAYKKNGEPLCAAFQQRQCGRAEQECRGDHQCAALLKSGRVCGGRHPGAECRDKRVMWEVQEDGDTQGASSSTRPSQLWLAAQAVLKTLGCCFI